MFKKIKLKKDTFWSFSFSAIINISIHGLTPGAYDRNFWIQCHRRWKKLKLRTDKIRKLTNLWTFECSFFCTCNNISRFKLSVEFLELYPPLFGKVTKTRGGVKLKKSKIPGNFPPAALMGQKLRKQGVVKLKTGGKAQNGGKAQETPLIDV